MRVGLTLGYWSPDGPDDQAALVEEADRLGYSVCWAAEAYGSDAVTVLSYLAARTTRIDLGSAVLQIPARTPAMTAMTAASLDLLSDGRFRLGLGVSGPQVSEGWYGVPFAKPLQRTRDYVGSVRSVLRREPQSVLGEGKPIKLALRPKRKDMPIYLAAVGPKNLELTGEIADGWLGVFVAPEFLDETLTHIRRGRDRSGRAGNLDGFDVCATVPVSIGDDLEACAEIVRAYTALYIGGMGSRKDNFYNALAVRMGYGEAAAEVQDLFLAGNYREAAAAVPFEFVDRTSLLGPIERIRERVQAYSDAGVTTLSILPFAAGPSDRISAVREMASLIPGSPEVLKSSDRESE